MFGYRLISSLYHYCCSFSKTQLNHLDELWFPHCDVTGMMVSKGNHPHSWRYFNYFREL